MESWIKEGNAIVGIGWDVADDGLPCLFRFLFRETKGELLLSCYFMSCCVVLCRGVVFVP